MLYNLYKLSLCNCINITDVSMLGNLHTLYLIGCKNITDVSMLCNVNTLYLTNYDNIPNKQIINLKKKLKNFIFMINNINIYLI